MSSPIASLANAHAVVDKGTKQLSGMMRDLRWTDQSDQALAVALEVETEFLKHGLRVPDGALREWALALIDCGEIVAGFSRLLDYWQRDPTNREAAFLLSGVRAILPDSAVSAYDEEASACSAATVHEGMRDAVRWFDLNIDTPADILRQINLYGFALIRGAFAGYSNRPKVGEDWWRTLRPAESDDLKAYIHSTPLKNLYDLALNPDWNVHATSIVRQVGPRPDSYLGYHQDIVEVHSLTKYLSCWTSFADAGVELPGLHLAGIPMTTVLPYEHREREGCFGRYTRTDVCGNDLGVTPTMQVGDLIVQTMYSVHRTQNLYVKNYKRDSIDFRILSHDLAF